MSKSIRGIFAVEMEIERGERERQETCQQTGEAAGVAHLWKWKSSERGERERKREVIKRHIFSDYLLSSSPMLTRGESK